MRVEGSETAGALSDVLDEIGTEIRSALAQAHEARERALRHCRETIRSSGLSIRGVHRLDPEATHRMAAEAERSLREAQRDLEPFPRLAAAGFLHDAEKEYAEARLTAALVYGEPISHPGELGVSLPAWLNGLAEAASELRRHLLDRLRGGEIDHAVALLAAMDDCYDMLVTIDVPDAVSGGLRRTTDALRAVIERTRADVTTTVLQVRLQRAIEGRGLG
ncbi:MAG: haloacid dehalogenase [Actinomycetota bacterium]|nr:haloacid dehalogenase [Actinomycetota bacterium]